MFNTIVKRAFGLVECHPGRIVFSIGAVFALAYGASLVIMPKPNGQIVTGDAAEHYVQLRSIVFDQDLQFLNDYAGLYRVDRSVLEETAWTKATPTGHMRNYMPVGPALLWMPLFLTVTAAIWVLNMAGVPYALDGFGRAFQATAGFSGIIAATAGAWLTYLTAVTLFDRRTAIWSTIGIWIGSGALYYSLVSPAYSHAASMLTTSAFWLVWVRTSGRQGPSRYFPLGLLIGCAALMRWQDMLLVAIPALDALWHRLTVPWQVTASRIAATCAGAAVAFTPQAAVWMVLYGSPATIPQGAGFMRWTDPALVAVLFSDNHGLITWTPLIALSVAGLALLVRRAPLVGVGAIVFFAAAWYTNAAAADWWAGEAFGARRFISCYPALVLGLAATLDRLGKPALTIAVPVVFGAYNILLLLHYQAFMHGLAAGVPYPSGFADLWLTRFRIPFDLLRAWLARG